MTSPNQDLKGIGRNFQYPQNSQSWKESSRIVQLLSKYYDLVLNLYWITSLWAAHLFQQIDRTYFHSDISQTFSGIIGSTNYSLCEFPNQTSVHTSTSFSDLPRQRRRQIWRATLQTLDSSSWATTTQHLRSLIIQREKVHKQMRHYLLFSESIGNHDMKLWEQEHICLSDIVIVLNLPILWCREGTINITNARFLWWLPLQYGYLWVVCTINPWGLISCSGLRFRQTRIS
jgi:hypothetical protein